jgi:hypothetical protein
MLVGEFDDSWGDTGTVSTAALYPGGWGQLARADSLKVFLVITDDDSTAVPPMQRRCARLTWHSARPYWSTRTRPGHG